MGGGGGSRTDTAVDENKDEVTADRVQDSSLAAEWTNLCYCFPDVHSVFRFLS